MSLDCAAGEAGSTAAAVIANCVPALPELEFRSFATLNAGKRISAIGNFVCKLMAEWR